MRNNSHFAEKKRPWNQAFTKLWCTFSAKIKAGNFNIQLATLLFLFSTLELAICNFIVLTFPPKRLSFAYM